MDVADQQMNFAFRDSPEADAIAQANRKTLVDALTSLLAGDEAAFWAIYDPAVTFYEAPCLPYGGEHKGLEATKAAFAEMCATFADMHTVFEAVLTDQDLVILYQTITFKVAANGNTGSLPVSEVFRFKGGKVVEWRACYFDSSMVAKAITG
jgi:limonene-1,2-epoxide hydrolase